MKKLLMLALALALLGCQQEKVHRGKPASAWVKELKEGKWAGERWRAAQALGEMGPQTPGAVPALVAALSDRDHLVRWNAAGALGRYGAEARPAVSALRELAAKDPDRAVRQVAESSLREIEHTAKAGEP